MLDFRELTDALILRRLPCRASQVVGSESGGIFTTPLHFRNSGVVEVRKRL